MRKLTALTAAVAAAGLLVTVGQPTVAEPRKAPADGPNIVLVTTDDMRADDIKHMPKTRRLLGQFELTDFVSNHPVCCPARAELLTGQFAQNNGVHHNGGGEWGGYAVLNDKDNTVARWFRQSGYNTALVGKFINGWKPKRSGEPRGWTDFHPLTGYSYSAYMYRYFDNGRARRAPEGLHTNDFVTRETLAHFKKYDAAKKPFFLWASYVAPHTMSDGNGFGPPIPAARHVGSMKVVQPAAKSAPSYESPSERQRARALYQDAVVDPSGREVARAGRISLRKYNQARLESLQSVDEGVARMVRTLRRLDQLKETVIVFTSDNGFLMGEHGQMGKNSFYEESLRVPLLARGPGVASGRSAKGSMITDLAPSLAALGGVEPQRAVDGRSDLFEAGGGWDDLLIQAGQNKAPWLWRGVRNQRWTYVETEEGETLLFDRDADPYQLDNLAGEERGTESQLSQSLRQFTE